MILIQLVITEKPSVARAIAQVLGASDKRDGYFEGNGWLVGWCVGHLVELAPADAYDPRYSKWTYADLPIVPGEWQYRVLPDTRKQYNILAGLMNDHRVDTVVCATDAGRECGLYQQRGQAAGPGFEGLVSRFPFSARPLCAGIRGERAYQRGVHRR